MDRQEQLRAYTLQIVALGQAALAIYRRGEWLPDELIALAEDLLALEAPLGAAAGLPEPNATLAGPEPEAVSTALTDEAPALAATGEMTEVDAVPPGPETDEAATGMADAEPAGGLPQPDAAAFGPEAAAQPADGLTLAESETGDDLAPLFVTVAPDESDDWLQALAEEQSESPVASPEDGILVLDVEQEPGGGPAVIDEPLTALPPLVIDAARDLSPEEEMAAPVAAGADGDDPAVVVGVGAPTVFSSGVGVWPPAAEVAPPAAAGAEAAPASGGTPATLADEEPGAEERFCANCGAPLRPGKRFCYRCGAPVASPAPQAERPAPAPALPPTPLSEMPTIIGGPYQSAPANDVRAPAEQFCNNCGRGVAKGETVCPECGSRDIG